MARQYNPKLPLAFIHVPKSGGTSLKDAFQNWFGERLLLHYPNPVAEQAPAKLNPGPGDCVYGHFNKDQGYGIGANYPQIEQMITVLRDPFEAAVSAYYYVRKVGKNWAKPPPPLLMDLPTYLREKSPGLFNHLPVSTTSSDFKSILDRNMLYIGITERMQESLDIMAVMLEKKRYPQSFKNRTERPNQDYQELRKIHRQHHPRAYQIYDYALCGHIEYCRDLGIDHMQPELEC